MYYLMYFNILKQKYIFFIIFKIILLIIFKIIIYFLPFTNWIAKSIYRAYIKLYYTQTTGHQHDGDLQPEFEAQGDRNLRLQEEQQQEHLQLQIVQPQWPPAAERPAIQEDRLRTAPEGREQADPDLRYSL